MALLLVHTAPRHGATALDRWRHAASMRAVTTERCSSGMRHGVHSTMAVSIAGSACINSRALAAACARSELCGGASSCCRVGAVASADCADCCYPPRRPQCRCCRRRCSSQSQSCSHQSDAACGICSTLTVNTATRSTHRARQRQHKGLRREHNTGMDSTAAGQLCSNASLSPQCGVVVWCICVVVVCDSLTSSC